MNVARLAAVTGGLALLAGCHSVPQATATSAAASSAAAQPTSVTKSLPAAPSTLAAYDDRSTGVHFNYPNVWKPFAIGQDIAYPSFRSDTLEPKAGFYFSPKGNLYEKTNLIDLSFFYGVAENTAPSACAAIAKQSATGASATRFVTYNGKVFSEASGADGAMCHDTVEIVDTVPLSNNRCAVFERSFETRCADVIPGSRALTDTETRALQKHLDAVMQSVTIR